MRTKSSSSVVPKDPAKPCGKSKRGLGASPRNFSSGQRPLILLARAMVKSPVLLIVDEPCHGLDIPNRIRILGILEKIGRTRTQLLYVTNHREEILNCISHVL